MQLSPQETSAAFWHGAKKGLMRSLGYIAVGAAIVGVLIAVHVLPWAAVTAGILTGLSTAITVGMFSGQNALAQYHQQKHNQVYEAKIARLEGHAYEPEFEAPLTSPGLATILEHGTRADKSFAQTEEARVNAPSTPTLQ